MTAVSLEQDGDIAIVRVDNPPVNALSAAVRTGLLEAVRTIEGNGRIEGAVLLCAGRTFMAGADVREFGKELPGPDLPTVVQAIASSPKPWLAAIHGTALGGGLEVALGCHWRVAAPDARLGLPEVKLGLIPGAGGTQLLPRIVGLERALDLVASGRQIEAAEARELDLVDALIEGDLREGAIAFLRERLAAGAIPPRAAERPVPPFDQTAVAKLAAGIRRRARGLEAPVQAAESVLAAATLPLAEGLACERATFLRLRESAQAKALRHLFFAEREAAKVPGLEAVVPREIRHVGVIGAGTMGTGIAIAFLDAGYPVTIVETSAEALARGRARIEEAYQGLVKRGRLGQAEAAARLARLEGTSEPEALAAADLVVEAVFEDMAVKSALFAHLGRILRPGAVIATNTSYLDVAALARASSRPRDFLGLHFFAPANVMRLLEVVRTDKVAPEVLATGLAVARKLGKIAVVAGNGDGFIGNRIWAFYRRQLEYLLEDGADPYTIDAAMTAYGFPMGPFAVFDLSGLDIALAQRKRRAATRPAGERYVRIPDILCELGRLGRKTGAGWYRYTDGRAEPDPAVLEVIAAERTRRGTPQQSFTAEAIQAHARAAMVNEAARVLAEGIALRPSDIDVVLVHGYGFPSWRGGPLFEADTIGLDRVLADVVAMAAVGGVGSEPAPLLVELARRGSTFGAWAGKESA
ncbi:3-hydroxyacyl-CoA dehydrogenase NAD-binding domain-containing protein [Benzoatithermus flavus]|uniref:3-hydroxyacyl-CoA dehydrogenase NAD-binding domain-containing protein n=1 Tax=Benzoatithermus flavus TaxID=3108223 RepID=A0ABU8XUI5_9PROT